MTGIKKKRKTEKLISLLVACLCVVNLVGCSKVEEQQVAVETFENYKNTQEKAIEHNLALINTAKKVKDYEQNIVYGWAIKQARTAEENTTNPIILTDINNTDKLWEAYVIPKELEAYACSLKNTLNDVYIVEILKPKNEYIENVEKSIKLIRSGYIGGMTGQHKIEQKNVYTEKVGSCYIVCICPNAEQIGTSILNNLKKIQQSQNQTNTQKENK